jgi:mono/diheme cytochrome c family protein
MPCGLKWLGVPVAMAMAVAVGVASSAASPQQPAQPGQSRFTGTDLYRSYCAACHGKSARGDGPVGDLLKKRPPDLTAFARKNGGVFPSELVRTVIDGRRPVTGHGGKDMPVWGDAFQQAAGGSGEDAVQERIDALTRYLESIQIKATN